MSNNKIYWRGTEELTQDATFVKNAQNEFPEQLPIDQFLAKKELDSTNTSRRDFLKFMGFGITAATLAACEAPVTKSLPYLVKPNEVMPGIANYYASTYYDGHDFASILVKTREGRPIHIEGNKLSTFSKGGVSARINSSVLSLYNTKRYQQPMKDGAAADWATVDSEISSALANAKANGGNVRVLSSSIISPSSQALLKELGDWITAPSTDGVASTATFKHVNYDAVSAAGIIEANKRTHGVELVPTYNFEKANVVVSIGADFLVNWINPVGHSVGYAAMRNPESGMSRHYQFETVLSTTGSNADIRGAIKPSEQGIVAGILYNAIATQMGASSIAVSSFANDDNDAAGKIEKAASDLLNSKGKSLVISSSNDPNVQVVVNAINEMLANYGTTIDLNLPCHLRKGTDAGVAELIAEMNAGSVSTLLILGADPVYTMPSGLGFAEALTKVAVRISTAEKPDQTSMACNYVCPEGHYLEQWNDANPFGNSLSFSQPTIQAIYNTRQWQDSVLGWIGKGGTYYDYLKTRWNSPATVAEDPSIAFTSRWNKFIQEGVGNMDIISEPVAITYNPEAVSTVALAGSGEGWEVEFYTKTSIGIGSYADNPWLQELPDPITKVVWDHYATMNPADMKEAGLNTMMGEQQKAGVVRVIVGDKSMELPVVSLPGQKKGTIGVALGYGKATVEEDGVSRVIGENAFSMLAVNNGFISYDSSASFEKLERRYNIASTQSQHTMMGRKMLNETSLSSFKSEGREAWNKVITIANAYGVEQTVEELDLWNKHSIDLGHRWGMSIDLNTCIGCGSCVTACHSENNVPVVGKDEINRTRSMSWIRIDRYYSSDADPDLHGDLNQKKDYAAMEIPADYPEVGFMPVMCQHCNHAPCETVCPVAATTHSDEGLNQMTYNRCIGTRYCANNCPYKVRRFNWFNYIADHKFTGVNPAQDNLARMVLNPDVVVRSRGVMEKCSMCVQRIQAGKLQAKKNGAPIEDGAIQTACSSACPTNAITFGDINDSKSQVRALAQKDRAYHLLEEIGVQPNIWYQTKVRNTVETA